jgi:hypothetical protein
LPVAGLPARISVIEVGADGGAGPRTLEAMTVRVICESDESCESVLWAMEFGNAEHPSFATVIAGYSAPFLRLERGRNEFRARVERLPLLPGTYQVRTAISSRGVILAIRGYADAASSFSVGAAADPALSMAIYRKNLVILSTAWEQAPAAAESVPGES